MPRSEDVPPNKHQTRTQATKKKLIDAAYEIFTRDGFEASRIEDIAAQAGFTRGAFYAHFQSKNDLFFGLLESKAAHNKRSIQVAVERCRTPEERLAAFRRFYLDHSDDRQWAILLLEFKLYAIREPQLHRQLADVHRNLRARLSGWLREIGISEEKGGGTLDESLRAALEGAYLGLVLERAYDPKRLSDAQVRRYLGQIFDSLTASCGT